MLVYTPEEEEVFFEQIDKVYSLAAEGARDEAEAVLLQLASDVPYPREDSTLGSILLESIHSFYEQVGDSGKALSHFLEETDFLQEKMKSEPIRNPVHFVTTGSIFYDLKDYKSARSYFKIALSLGKNKIFSDFNPDFLHFALISEEEFEEYILTLDDSGKEYQEEELSETQIEKIEEYCALANEAMENSAYSEAILSFQQAIDVLPEPKMQWDAYAWIAVGLGDAYFCNEEYLEAISPMDSANSIIEAEKPDGFVYMRLGQIYFELDNTKEAKFYLKKAYKMEGEKFFEGENKKYLQFLKNND